MQILIAEDNNISRRLLETTLSRWGYDVITCVDGIAAWEVLQAPSAPQMAILDWMMPKMDGVELCRHVRDPQQRSPEPYIYLILLTSKSQKGDVIAGLEAGADDYLTKPFDRQELRMRLRAGQRIIELLGELRFAREELRDRAQHDSLTRLYNRATVLELLDRELARTHRRREGGHETYVSVILADLDHFKHVNDTYGHLAGDAVLRETSRRMREALRPYDSIGRYGGEEFLVVLSECDSTSAVTVAERLRVAVVEKAIVLPEGSIPVTMSAGITTSDGDAPC